MKPQEIKKQVECWKKQDELHLTKYCFLFFMIIGWNKKKRKYSSEELVELCHQIEGIGIKEMRKICIEHFGKVLECGK